jgi:hypothetical protein
LDVVFDYLGSHVLEAALSTLSSHLSRTGPEAAGNAEAAAAGLTDITDVRGSRFLSWYKLNWCVQ